MTTGEDQYKKNCIGVHRHSYEIVGFLVFVPMDSGEHLDHVISGVGVLGFENSEKKIKISDGWSKSMVSPGSIHCTDTPCTGIIHCTSGMDLVFPLKSWNYRGI